MPLSALLPLDVEIRAQPATLFRNTQDPARRPAKRRKGRACDDIEQRAARARRPHADVDIILLLEYCPRRPAES